MCDKTMYREEPEAPEERERARRALMREIDEEQIGGNILEDSVR